MLVFGGCLGLASCDALSDEPVPEPSSPSVERSCADLLAGDNTELSAAEFVRRSLVANLFLERSSHLAASRSSDPDVRDLARELALDHHEMAQRLVAVLPEAGVAARKPFLTGMWGRWMQELRARSPEALSGDYLAKQAYIHARTVRMLARYAEAGGNLRLRALAAEMLPLEHEHEGRLLAFRRSRGENGLGVACPPG